MNDRRPTPSNSQAGNAPQATAPAQAGTQVALRMAQYKRVARRHPRAAMGALAHWLRSLDKAPSSAAHTKANGAGHGATGISKCSASSPAAKSQK